MTNATAVVITPTTCDAKVQTAIDGVKKQTHRNVRHILVVDGPQFLDGAAALQKQGVDVCLLPENTHMGVFYGHRIYAGFAHLVNEEYVFLLDQDNWYEPEHVESMIDTIETKELNWAYSLRNIIDKNGEFLCQDNCESLGKWPKWNSYMDYHIDTNTYGFKNDFFKYIAHHWHGGYAQDRKFLTEVRSAQFRATDTGLVYRSTFDTSGRYTVNYRLDGNPDSAAPDFFLKGNDFMAMKYKGRPYPWAAKQTPVT